MLVNSQLVALCQMSCVRLFVCDNSIGAALNKLARAATCYRVERIRNVKIVEDKSKIALFYISTIKIFALFENEFCQQMWCWYFLIAVMQGWLLRLLFLCFSQQPCYNLSRFQVGAKIPCLASKIPLSFNSHLPSFQSGYEICFVINYPNVFDWSPQGCLPVQ